MILGLPCQREYSYVAIDPLQPMLGSVACSEILQVIDGRDALGLGGAEEVFLDRVGAGVSHIRTQKHVHCESSHEDSLISKRDLDGSIETMQILLVAGALVGLMLSHQGQKLLGRPTLCLEVVIVGSRGTSCGIWSARIPKFSLSSPHHPRYEDLRKEGTYCTS